MGRPRRRLSAELCAVTLIAACVTGTLGTVILIHRRPSRTRPAPPQAVVVAPSVPEPAPPDPEPEKPAPLPTPEPPKVAEKPPEPPEDPTKKIVAELARAEAEQRLETAKAEAQLAAIMKATDSARAESQKWKRSLSMSKGQVAARVAEAAQKESTASLALMERDALAKRRDAQKQVLKEDLERPSYAVLPHKGPNGTWQRPIVLECKDESVYLQPNGPTFNLMDLGLGFSANTPPFVSTISREAVRIQRQYGPDGKDVIPYIFFIVRPSGIRAYYQARVRLERLGIAFGYELADPDWAIDFPNLDHPETWDGSPPPTKPRADALAANSEGPRGEGGDGSGPNGQGAGGRPSRDEIDNAFRWPKAVPGMEGRGGGGDLANTLQGDSPGGINGTDPRRAGMRGYPGGRDQQPNGLGRGGVGDAEHGFPDTDRSERSRQNWYDEAWERAMRALGTDRPAGLPIGAQNDRTWPRGDTGLDQPGEPSPTGTGGLGERTAETGGVSLRDLAGGLGNGRVGALRGANLARAGQIPGPGGSPLGSGLPGEEPGKPDGAGNEQPGGNRSRLDLAYVRQIPGPPESPNGAGRPGMEGGLPGEKGGRGVAGGDGVGPNNSQLSGNGNLNIAGNGTGTGSGSNGQSPPSGTGAGANSNSGGQGSDGQQSGEGSPGGANASNAGANGTPPMPNTGMSGAGSSPTTMSGKPGIPGSRSSRDGVSSPLGSTAESYRPFELIVSCSKHGVAIHPGNYRVTIATLKSKDSLLVAQLRAIVRRKEDSAPDKTFVPSIRFVIEPGGTETYSKAKSQLLFSNLDWPTSMQVISGETQRVFQTDGW